MTNLQSERQATVHRLYDAGLNKLDIDTSLAQFAPTGRWWGVDSRYQRMYYPLDGLRQYWIDWLGDFVSIDYRIALLAQSDDVIFVEFRVHGERKDATTYANYGVMVYEFPEGSSLIQEARAYFDFNDVTIK